jgi:hypothetical protein
MPATTTKGFPYPVGSDPLADTDVRIKDLADFLEANNGRIKWGLATIDIVTVNVAATLAVVFPTAYPVGVTPVVVAICRGATGTSARFVQVTSESNTGFTLVGVNAANNADMAIGWVAIG